MKYGYTTLVTSENCMSCFYFTFTLRLELINTYGYLKRHHIGDAGRCRAAKWGATRAVYLHSVHMNQYSYLKDFFFFPLQIPWFGEIRKFSDGCNLFFLPDEHHHYHHSTSYFASLRTSISSIVSFSFCVESSFMGCLSRLESLSSLYLLDWASPSSIPWRRLFVQSSLLTSLI